MIDASHVDAAAAGRDERSCVMQQTVMSFSIG